MVCMTYYWLACHCLNSLILGDLGGTQWCLLVHGLPHEICPIAQVNPAGESKDKKKRSNGKASFHRCNSRPKPALEGREDADASPAAAAGPADGEGGGSSSVTCLTCHDHDAAMQPAFFPNHVSIGFDFQDHGMVGNSHQVSMFPTYSKQV